ncbi:MAG: hypothetical protein J1G02_06215 [Clostridiales bacterium]|nr:hypothetical protein [Clostridiales bacterium]
MKNSPDTNILKWKKAVLALVIINFIVLIALALVEFIPAMTTEYEPSSEQGHTFIIIRLLLLIFAAYFAVSAIITLIFGLFAYQGKRWSAIVLLVFSLTAGVGYIGVISAIIALVYSCKNSET